MVWRVTSWPHKKGVSGSTPSWTPCFEEFTCNHLVWRSKLSVGEFKRCVGLMN